MRRAVTWREEPLTRHHDRATFDCGVPALNEYLRRYARQNHESGGAKTFVALSVDTPTSILGYYTISPGAMAFADAPASVTRRLGRYDVPVFRLGRLAVAVGAQGRGLGGDLLLAAGARALAVAQDVGGVALANRREGCARGGLVRTLRRATTAGRPAETRPSSRDNQTRAGVEVEVDVKNLGCAP